MATFSDYSIGLLHRQAEVDWIDRAGFDDEVAAGPYRLSAALSDAFLKAARDARAKADGSGYSDRLDTAGIVDGRRAGGSMGEGAGPGGAAAEYAAGDGAGAVA